MDHLRRLILGLLALLVSGLASAQITYSGTTGMVPSAPLNTLTPMSDFERLVRAPVGGGGGADIIDKYTGKINNKALDIEAARRIGSSNVGRAAARALLTPGGVAGAVIVAGAASTFCKVTTGSLVCDDTQAKQDLICYQPSPFNTTQCLGSIEAALGSAWSGYWIASNCGPYEPYNICTNVRYGPITGNSRIVTYWDYRGMNVNVTLNAVQQTQKVCPAVSNYEDIRYREVGGPANWEGRCPKGVTHAPTEDELAAKLAPVYPPADHVEVIKEALQKGADLSPLASPQTVTGPASVTQAPVTSTTTSPTGTPQTTTTTTTNYITYEGSNFSWTTVNNYSYPDGSTKTEEKPPEDRKSECEMNPQAVGCQKMDTPNAEDIGKRDINVSFNPDPGWGASDASCPAPRTVSVLGQSIEIDNTLVCQFLSGIRFAVIGVSALVAGLIFVGGFRGQS